MDCWTKRSHAASIHPPVIGHFRVHLLLVRRSQDFLGILPKH
jgi:hypothetical protein